MSAVVAELVAAGVPPDEIERLLSEWGGLPLSVPRQCGPAHRIAVIAGPACARQLCRMYGGERIVLPLGARFKAERRRERIAALKRAGLKHPDIARQLRLHLRLVQRIAASLIPPEIERAPEA